MAPSASSEPVGSSSIATSSMMIRRTDPRGGLSTTRIAPAGQMHVCEFKEKGQKLAAASCTALDPVTTFLAYSEPVLSRTASGSMTVRCTEHRGGLSMLCGEPTKTAEALEADRTVASMGT